MFSSTVEPKMGTEYLNRPQNKPFKDGTENVAG